MIALKLEGVDGLVNKYKQAADTMAEQVRAAVAETAQAIAESAKQNCPDNLQESITAEIADDGMSATISANSPEAALVEYGVKAPGSHKGTAQRPFMNPAFEENAPRLMDKLNDISLD